MTQAHSTGTRNVILRPGRDRFRVSKLTKQVKPDITIRGLLKLLDKKRMLPYMRRQRIHDAVLLDYLQSPAEVQNGAPA
jgi:hypothetical protein